MSPRSYRVRGRVQGVGFRSFVVRLGNECGLRGGVRNERDGSVTAVAAGDATDLARFLRGLTVGPSAARVEQVDESEVAALPPAAEFDATF